jgi:hypothetical protein
MLNWMVLIKLGYFIFYVPFMLLYFARPLYYVDRNMENHPGKQYNHKN